MISNARQIFNHGVSILMKAISGFSMGTGYAVLCSSMLLPHNLIFLMILLGSSFALIQIIKESYRIYSQYLHKLYLARLHKQFKRGIVADTPKLHRKLIRFTSRFVRINKRILSFLGLFANGMGLVGLFFFFTPFYTAHLAVLTKILISVVIGLCNSLLGLYYKYYLRLQPKEKIKHIENYSLPYEPPPHLQHYKNGLPREEVFSRPTQQQRRSFLLGTTLVDFILTFNSSLSTIFGILVLFCIGFSLSLPWIQPITALIIAAFLSFGLAIRNIFETYSEQVMRIKYIDDVVDSYEQHRKFSTFFKYKQRKKHLFNLDNSEYRDFRQNKTLDFFWTFINGASTGIGFGTSLVLIYLLSTPVAANPILLSLIFLSGVIVGCLNIYKDYYSKDSQHEIIDSYRFKLSNLYVESRPQIQLVQKHKYDRTPVRARTRTSTVSEETPHLTLSHR